MRIEDGAVVRSPLRWVRQAWYRLRGGYWLVPLTCVAVAVVAAFALIRLDRFLQDDGRFDWSYAGGPQNASDTLTTIASSMITFTGLVFSITVLALQLTSSQFSPRALRNFLRDRFAQFALGIFIATFAYSFAALSAVRVESEDDPSFVPGVTVTGAFLLIGISLVTFVQYIHHTAQSIRAVTIIERIAQDTRGAIDAMYPVHHSEAAPVKVPRIVGSAGEPDVLGARRAGVIVDVDLDGLAESVGGVDGICVEVLHPVGSYVCEGQALMRIWSAVDSDVGAEALHRFVLRDNERTMHNDAAFGLRQLVDIAERALSPGVNDPTTAVQCLDRIHDLLRRLAGRHVPTMRTGEDDEGVVRAFAPSPSFDDYVALGTEEIWRCGKDSVHIQRRLRSMFEDLIGVAADQPDRLAELHRRADALAAIPIPVSWPPLDPIAARLPM